MLLQSRIATASRIFSRIDLLNHDRSGYALDFIRNGTKARQLHFNNFQTNQIQDMKPLKKIQEKFMINSASIVKTVENVMG